MVGASSRLLFLLTNPISLRHHRPFALFRLPRGRSLTLSAAPNHLVHLSRRNSLIPIKFAQNFYSRATNNAFQENNHTAANDYHVPPPHPWPEWSRLLESLSVAGYFNGDRNIEDEFMANENLSMEFVAAANSCLAFARDRPDILGWLPRKDIQVLIDDGYPFLFKSAHESERRMRSFLQGSNEATSVDLMKYILSCASNPVVYPERNIKEATESSVRSLLQEMANLSYRGRASGQFESVVRDEQLPRNLGPNITMKRGDWICPKCSFMNFARNTKCLECEELRPQRQLTDGEWDCPQCNFFNYRRNVVCLKCECRRPGEAPSPGPTNTPSERQMIGSHYRNNYDDNGGNKFRVANKNLETSVGHDQDQFDGNSFNRHQNDRNHGRPSIAMRDHSGYVPFVPLPADMFAKKPEKTTNEHSEAAVGRSSESPKTDRDSQCSEKSATYIQSRYSQDIDKEEKTERWFKKVKELHGVTGPTSAVSHDNFLPIRKGENHFIDSKKKDQPLSPWAMEQGSSSSFVPFPPDHFAKKGEQQQPSHSQVNENLVQGMGNQHMHGTNNNLDSRSSIGTNTDSSNDQLRGNETSDVRSGWTGKSLEGSAVTETDPLDMSEEAKAERWFRRVAQIKDISELSQIPDEDFPSIMPMRKGVNRFVVSKRKTPLERRLTSPQYRKNLRIMSSDPMKREGDDDN